MPFTDQHLFFDLDRTLWDFDKNSEIALRSLFETEELAAMVDKEIILQQAIALILENFI
jgi:putative hydrolase of the HAD superfamily